MSFPETLVVLGDPPQMPRAGYCGCGEYVGPHHVCPPVVRRCVVCERPAELFDIGAGPWCSDTCRAGVVRVPLKRCCYAVLEGEDCDCAEFLSGRWQS